MHEPTEDVELTVARGCGAIVALVPDDQRRAVAARRDAEALMPGAAIGLQSGFEKIVRIALAGVYPCQEIANVPLLIGAIVTVSASAVDSTSWPGLKAPIISIERHAMPWPPPVTSVKSHTASVVVPLPVAPAIAGNAPVWVGVALIWNALSLAAAVVMTPSPVLSKRRANMSHEPEQVERNATVQSRSLVTDAW